ncbi:MAG TPA: hypothetical protein VHA12_04280 [Candidatus Nanoarchaeia archaeon]|nr:hypothetical protein [Candidatus Nanoarchaeia archaeon]
MSVEEEIQSGIKNALERGVPLDKVVQTFINAGYQSAIVQSAARIVTEGATTIAPQISLSVSQKSSLDSSLTGSSQPEVKNEFSFPSQPMSVPAPAGGIQTYSPKPEIDSTVHNENTSNLKIIVLVVILLILLGTLAASLLFKEQILALLG